MNDTLKRALTSAHIPARVEPTGKQQAPRRNDADTLGKFSNFIMTRNLCRYLISIILRPFKSVMARLQKRQRYENGGFIKKLLREKIIFSCHLPLRRWVQSVMMVLNSSQKSAKKIEDVTGEHRSREFLIQRISVAVQRNNAACVMGTFPEGKALDEIFLI